MTATVTPSPRGGGRRTTVIGRRTTVIGRRTVRLTLAGGVVLLIVLVGIAWRAQSVGWFLLFPLLLVGILAAVALGVLAALRHV